VAESKIGKSGDAGWTEFSPPGGNYKIESIERDFSPQALAELKSWLETVGLALPVTGLLGFSQFTPDQSNVNADESTSSVTYTDLGTVGPTITGLSPGRYLLIYGCIHDSSGGEDGFMAPSINGAAASDNDAAYSQAAAAGRFNISKASLQTLSGSNNNTVTMKYRVSGSTSNFKNRWLVCMKVANA
jgi:hypothetical protein